MKISLSILYCTRTQQNDEKDGNPYSYGRTNLHKMLFLKYIPCKIDYDNVNKLIYNAKVTRNKVFSNVEETV